MQEFDDENGFSKDSCQFTITSISFQPHCVNTRIRNFMTEQLKSILFMTHKK